MLFKYIMYQFDFQDENVAFVFQIFPQCIVHKQANEAWMREHDRCPLLPGICRAVSAGFVRPRLVNMRVWMECSGESESLKLKSHPDNQKIMELYHLHHGQGFERRPQ